MPHAIQLSANELFTVVASGKVRIDVNQRFSLKGAAGAHKALGSARHLRLNHPDYLIRI